MSSRARTVADFGDGIATADIGDGQVTAAKLFSGFANGITSASTYRLTADKTLGTATEETFTANWEEDDANGYGRIGSAVSESGGTFSFPETGVYLVEFHVKFSKNGDDRQLEIYIYSTTDNGSSYQQRTSGACFIQQTASNFTFTTGVTSCLIDVTSTANVKFQCRSFSRQGGTNVQSSTNANNTYVNVIRLGDT